MNEQDEKYMQTALKLAQRGIGSVEPNPAVGCVIVKGSQIVGTGWHKKYGAEHAELIALKDCQTLGVSPKRATMYVTLEPCSHYGKTPPCADAIIASQLARVVVATGDPSEHANGAGLEKLRDAGLQVETGLCESEARLLNAPFFKYALTGRCWVTLKWAQSIDGRLAHAQPTDCQRWISNELSRKDMHRLRQQAQAILVGINTVLADDPLLSSRPGKGKELTRIVLDSQLRIPLDSQLVRTAKKSPLLVFTAQQAVNANPQTAQELIKKAVELVICPDTPGRSNLHFVVDELGSRGIAHLLVEGGPRVICSFLTERLVDRICVYIAARLLGSRGAADLPAALANMTETLDLNYVDIKRLDNDVCIGGFSRKALDEICLVDS